jgi:hypothetical protein
VVEAQVTVEVVIPWAGGCPHRERALDWVLGQYAAAHPGWAVTVAEGPEQWVKADAVMPAVEASGADIVVVADADVLCDGIERAVYAIACGEANWGMPHLLVHRLDETGTDRVLADEPWERQPLDQRPYRGVWGGGLVVARRETLLEAPFDHRYVGWGQEDQSVALALDCLAGRGWRGTADLIHLFHPPQARVSRARGSEEGWALYRRYCKARNDPAAMRALVEEGRHVDQASTDPALHDRLAA